MESKQVDLFAEFRDKAIDVADKDNCFTLPIPYVSWEDLIQEEDNEQNICREVEEYSGDWNRPLSHYVERLIKKTNALTRKVQQLELEIADLKLLNHYREPPRAWSLKN